MWLEPGSVVCSFPRPTFSPPPRQGSDSEVFLNDIISSLSRHTSPLSVASFQSVRGWWRYSVWNQEGFSFLFFSFFFIWKTDMNIHPFGWTFPAFSLDWLHLARCLLLRVTMCYPSVQSSCGCGDCFCLLSCVACNKWASRSLMLSFLVYVLLWACGVAFFVTWGDCCKRGTIIMCVSLWRRSSSAVVCTGLQQ